MGSRANLRPPRPRSRLRPRSSPGADRSHPLSPAEGAKRNTAHVAWGRVSFCGFRGGRDRYGHRRPPLPSPCNGPCLSLRRRRSAVFPWEDRFPGRGKAQVAEMIYKTRNLPGFPWQAPMPRLPLAISRPLPPGRENPNGTGQTCRMKRILHKTYRLSRGDFQQRPSACPGTRRRLSGRSGQRLGLRLA
jgi:hypothetical protein